MLEHSPMLHNKSHVLHRICDALRDGDKLLAGEIARRDYPFHPQPAAQRRFSRSAVTSLFLEDGCIDRYSGARLVFPGVLLLLSRLLPEEIPYHINWRIGETHMAFWELYPTVDHVVPVTRGGRDERGNLVTTSMMHNSVKAHWTLEELRWSLHPPGDLTAWDGLSNWFLDYVSAHPEHAAEKRVKAWRLALNRALAKSAAIQPTRD